MMKVQVFEENVEPSSKLTSRILVAVREWSRVGSGMAVSDRLFFACWLARHDCCEVCGIQSVSRWVKPYCSLRWRVDPQQSGDVQGGSGRLADR